MSQAVAGVVLAAGASTRMGRNKLLFALRGTSVLRRAAVQASAAGLDPLIVVLGYEADQAVRELEGLNVRPVLNLAYTKGITGSLRAGIEALPADVQAAVVMLADMPLITSDMIATLVSRFRAGSAPLVVSEYGGVVAPPILFHRALFPELLTTSVEGCGRDLVRRHRHEAETVIWPASALADLDRPEDYERIRAQLEAG
jgi:molybdenum cofactor cytidylyltransferase